jgi:hypothetical protein
MVEELVEREYAFGFHSDLDTELAPKGLSENVVRLISAKKDEPDWLLEWRLGAFRHFLTLVEPKWPNLQHPPIDYQDMHYWAAPKPKPQLASLDEVDPEIRATFDKLGISLDEQKRLSGVAVDAILDSVSVATTFKKTLVLRSGSRASRSGAQVPGFGGRLPGQLLRCAELGGVLRRVVLLHPGGGAMPDGVVDVLPDQRRADRPVRTDLDHRRRGCQRQLSRGLHRTDA